jgi:hypothetical protein
MAVITTTTYICDRCGGEGEQKPGTFALYDVVFYTSEKNEKGELIVKRVQFDKACFDAVYAFATTKPVPA